MNTKEALEQWRKNNLQWEAEQKLGSPKLVKRSTMFDLKEKGFEIKGLENVPMDNDREDIEPLPKRNPDRFRSRAFMGRRLRKSRYPNDIGIKEQKLAIKLFDDAYDGYGGDI
tara:strand:+ start:235 stop:573 length:339 start_codon:yes stop_codon:yes gene_type:complete